MNIPDDIKKLIISYSLGDLNSDFLDELYKENKNIILKAFKMLFPNTKSFDIADVKYYNNNPTLTYGWNQKFVPKMFIEEIIEKKFFSELPPGMEIIFTYTDAYFRREDRKYVRKVVEKLRKKHRGDFVPIGGVFWQFIYFTRKDFDEYIDELVRNNRCMADKMIVR